MKKVLLLIIFLTSLISCAQEKTVEEIYQDCYYKSMPDNGKLLKKYHKQYEQILIANGVLTSNSGASYYDLIKGVLKNGYVNTKTNFSFSDSVMKLPYAKMAYVNRLCSKKIKALRQYKSSKSYTMGQRLDSLASLGPLDADKSFSVTLAVFDAMDLESTYYQIRVLHLIELINAMYEFDEAYYTEEQLENALQLSISAEAEIAIKNKAVSLEQMDQTIEAYLLSKKTKSLITIQTSRDLNYGKFVKIIERIQTVFQKVKDNWAMTNYNKKFDDLMEEHKALIDQVYSFNIKENEPK